MSSSKPIGGYFGLELRESENQYYADALRLNTGRNSFEYVLLANKTQHVYMPKYTCEVMLEPLKKLNISYSFYSINKNFEIINNIKLKENELLIYINYFGLKDKYCEKLSNKYESKLVLDYSQSFYTPPNKISHTFYSPRKFFGLPDGGLLYTAKKLEISLNIDTSHQRFSHLLKRRDLSAESGYADFKKNDARLSNQPIKKMSHLTEKLLKSIDYEEIKKKRLENFSYLEKKLGKINKLKIDPSSITCPMCYPYYSESRELRQKLINNKIFIPTYWPNVLDWCKDEEIEYKLAQNILPIPIDQRYCKEDMEQIIGILMKVNIRPLEEKDAYTSVKWRNMPEIWKYTKFSATKKITIKDELNWIGRTIADNTDVRFAILADGKYVGNIYLTNINNGVGEYHIFIGEKDYLKKGIAREASLQIIEYGKNTLKLKKIELGVKQENKNALNLYISLGFKEYGKDNEFIRMSLNL